MLGIFKKREFARLFQKSTIRRNRLADIAKTKRINRNFYDIVEKAKWLKEMKDSGLMDDDTLSTPSITEIPLKQLTVNVELGSLAHKMETAARSSAPVLKGSFAGAEAMKCISSSESSSPESDDSLLGGSRATSNKSLPSTCRASSPVLTLKTLKSSPSMSARRLRRFPREHRQRNYCSHQLGMVSSPVLDIGPNNILEVDNGLESPSNRLRSLSVDNSNSAILSLECPPNNTRQRQSSRSSLPNASVVNELSPRCGPKHQIPLTVENYTVAPPLKLSDSLPNGNLVQRLVDFDVAGLDCDGDSESEDEDDDMVYSQKPIHILSEHSIMLKCIPDDRYNIANAGASASNYSNSALLPKTSNISLARTLLYKTRSCQDHLCSAADSAQDEASIEPFCLDAVTKEELLVLWKTSEIELNKRLDAALREKSRLERKLAMLQMHSPV